jgi:hypothetical protein
MWQMVIGMDVAAPEVFSKKENTHEVFSKKEMA